MLEASFEPGISSPYESRQKTLWLQDAVIQRRYNDCNREPSAYLSNKEAITQFPFMERQINREALRITRMGDRKSTSKSGFDLSQMFLDDFLIYGGHTRLYFQPVGSNWTKFNKV